MTEKPRKKIRNKRFKKAALITLAVVNIMVGIGYYLYASGLSLAGAKHFDNLVLQMENTSSIVIDGHFYVDKKSAYLQTEIVDINHIGLFVKSLQSLNYTINYDGSKRRRLGAKCACTVGGQVKSVFPDGSKKNFYFHGQGLLAAYITELNIESFDSQKFFHDDLVATGIVFENVK